MLDLTKLTKRAVRTSRGHSGNYDRMAAPCGIAKTRVARRESGMVRGKTANCGIYCTIREAIPIVLE